jgi:hypothetical protein
LKFRDAPRKITIGPTAARHGFAGGMPPQRRGRYLATEQ